MWSIRCEQPSRDLPPLGFRGVKVRRFAARVVADVWTAVVPGVKVHMGVRVIPRPQRLSHAGKQANDARHGGHYPPRRERASRVDAYGTPQGSRLSMQGAPLTEGRAAVFAVTDQTRSNLRRSLARSSS